MDKEALKVFSELLDSKLGVLENKLNKNTILLENLTSKVETMSEVQNSHMEQNENAHNEIVKNLNERIDVIELAVKDTSNVIADIIDKIKFIGTK